MFCSLGVTNDMNYESEDERIESEDWNKAKGLNEEEFYKANSINSETNEPKNNKKKVEEKSVPSQKVNLEEEYEEFSPEEFRRGRLKEIIGLSILTVLLFVIGILIGRKMLLIDEDVTYKIPKNVAEKRIESKEEADDIEENTIIAEVDEVVEEETEEEKEEEEDLIVYARYTIQDANDDNKECEVTFGKESNFSFDLGKDGAYIFGNYHIDGEIITCNAITWRNQEKVEAINSTLKFKIVEKNLVQISEVTIYDGNEGLDQELINLDGLKVGMQYKYEKKVGKTK